MPSLKRRRFLQLLGAASVAPMVPALPGLPAQAAAGGTMSASAASKALWAGLHANAGSTSKFVGLARTMGLSNSAIQGVAARTIGVRLPLTALTNRLARNAAARAPKSPSPSHFWTRVRDKMKGALLNDTTDDGESRAQDLNRQSAGSENFIEVDQPNAPH